MIDEERTEESMCRVGCSPGGCEECWNITRRDYEREFALAGAPMKTEEE